MKNVFTTLAVCLSLLVPGLADAKKPPPPVEVACALLLSPDDSYVYTGESFTIKLIRVPSYPGAFRNPTIKIDVYYPSVDNVIPPVETKFTIPLFNVTYVETTIPVPLVSDGILLGEQVLIEAKVTEPTKNRNKDITTRCSTTAIVQQSPNDPPPAP
jgi:hypothetical protein